MELRVLKYFVMVAREENITKAAQLLHVTQPTLSRQLAALEEELGTKLFVRSSHHIVLTEDGLLLLRRAQEILQLADKTIRDLSHTDDILTGEISIGCGELQSMKDLASIISKFRNEYPFVHFEIFSGNTVYIKQQIEQGAIDIGLLVEPVSIDKYEFIRLPSKEHWGILLDDNNPLANKEFVTPQDIIPYPLFIPQSVPIKNELSSWFGEKVEEMNVVANYNLLYNCAMMIKDTKNIALCLQLNCKYDGIKFIPLSPEISLSSVLAWKAGQAFSPATATFIKFAKKCIKSIS